LLDSRSSLSDEFAHHVIQLPFAYGGAVGSGTFRCLPEDFIVNEQLSFEPSEEGEHVFLSIQKTALNTDDVAQTLARFASVKRRDVAYAGMKDRHARTTQTFSVHLPGKESPDWSELNSDNLKIIGISRHKKKLKTGAIKNNTFTITIKGCEIDEQAFRETFLNISKKGVPNYFMEQRFGRNGHNLLMAYDVFSKGESFKSKRVKGLLLSAVRSYLFNSILSKRVFDETWNKALSGEAFVLAGTRQFFVEESISEDIVDRLECHDIHPSGPLYGVGKATIHSIVEDIEQLVLKDHDVFCDGLVNEKVAGSRRALRVLPKNMCIEDVDETTKKLSFELPSGSYATAVLRELFILKNGSR